MHGTERRRSRRFPLQQPATIESGSGGLHEVSGNTENASLQGVFLLTDTPLAEGLQVRVKLLLRTIGFQGIRLHGSGRVVRVETKASGKFGIAIALEHFLSETIAEI
jgi:PilZ domain